MTFLSGKSRNKKFKIIQKKYLSLFVLGIFFVYSLILVWPNNAQAANCAFSCNDSSKTSAEYCASLYVGGRVGTTFSIDGPPDCDISKASCGLYSAPVCCCAPEDSIIVLNTPTPVSNAPKFNAPELQIQIPGLVFDEADVSCVNVEGGNYSCSINWIAKYVASIYNYGLTVGGILAALMLMAGGLLWLTSGGDSGKVSKAKGLIGGSITGLVILFSAYMILYEVNPELTKLKSITTGQAPNTPSGSYSSNINTDGWKWDPGIINQINDASPELANFLNCMRSNLPNGIGRISSISDSKYIGNLTACETSCNGKGCVHSCGSCHYGGGTGTNKSYAVDLGDEENTTLLVKAANACGVYTSGPGFILNEGDHLHISVPACPKK